MRYFYIQLTANAAADYRGVIFYSLLLRGRGTALRWKEFLSDFVTFRKLNHLLVSFRAVRDDITKEGNPSREA